MSPGGFKEVPAIYMTNKQPLLADEDGAEKEGAGSVGASAITLAKICVGCGVMALPWGFIRGGVLSAPGSALPCLRILCVHILAPRTTERLSHQRTNARAGMVLIGVWNWYTSLQLVRCKRALANDPSMLGVAEPQGRQRSAYSALAFAVLGHAGRPKPEP